MLIVGHICAKNNGLIWVKLDELDKAIHDIASDKF